MLTPILELNELIIKCCITNKLRNYDYVVAIQLHLSLRIEDMSMAVWIKFQ